MVVTVPALLHCSFFTEAPRVDQSKELGVPTAFVQDNHSWPAKGVVGRWVGIDGLGGKSANGLATRWLFRGICALADGREIRYKCTGVYNLLSLRQRAASRAERHTLVNELRGRWGLEMAIGSDAP